jgi:predicted nucleic acid-binding Zn ribbon protein
MEKHCHACGQKIKGRLDKIFCNDHCRSHYHNHKNRDTVVIMQKTNRILRKNRQILDSAFQANLVDLEVDFLSKLGFNPEFHTQIHRTEQGRWYFFIYDLGFEITENGRKMKLFKREKFNFPK